VSTREIPTVASPAQALGLDGSTASRLQEVLEHAAQTVPFYQRLAEGRSGLDYWSFPVLGKKRFIENLDDMMSTLYAGYDRVHGLAEVKAPHSLICEFTSGSSGYPLRCYKTVPERTRLALSLHKKRVAVMKDFSPARMFGFIHNTGFESHSYLDGLGNLSAENIGRVLLYLRDVAQPAVLHGNTMVFVYYADYIAKHGFDLKSWSIRFIESVSESMNEEQKRHIETQFRTETFNCYGCLECYNVAYDCRYHRLHLNENVVLEIVSPDTGEDLTATQKEGEVLLTSLVNRAQPFIRYKTGDLGWLEESSCPCGSPAKIVHLSGRRKIDYIKLLYTNSDPRLTICGYDIFATVMYRLVMGGQDHVSWYNVIQKELDLFEVLYIPKESFSADFPALFAQYAREELGLPARFEFIEKQEGEVLLINRKNRVFRSLLQND